METTTIEQFYKESAILMPEGLNKEIGHFNVFKTADIIAHYKERAVMPYNRRTYYKVSLLIGRNKAEYADKVIDVEKQALLFGTPRVPYHYVPQDEDQHGIFCVFTEAFLLPAKSGVVLDELPIFAVGGYPVFQLTDEECAEVQLIFEKMHKEINSDYVYKYDLIRNYLMELIHFGQKLQPAAALYRPHNSSARVSSLFIELLERQFPIDSQQQKLELRTAKDYADRLSIHVNHLNKVLRETTGSTTTAIIKNRIIQEAKILLKQTDWNISEIAYILGFEEVAHFSNFFKKQTSFSPAGFRV